MALVTLNGNADDQFGGQLPKLTVTTVPGAPSQISERLGSVTPSPPTHVLLDSGKGGSFPGPPTPTLDGTALTLLWLHPCSQSEESTGPTGHDLPHMTPL